MYAVFIEPEMNMSLAWLIDPLPFTICSVPLSISSPSIWPTKDNDTRHNHVSLVLFDHSPGLRFEIHCIVSMNTIYLINLLIVTCHYPGWSYHWVKERSKAGPSNKDVFSLFSISSGWYLALCYIFVLYPYQFSLQSSLQMMMTHNII